jgi:succinate dehydrogenase / fumarate reductase cytochrome b subunit
MKDFLCSTVGKKYIMGVTGLVWLGFVFAHMSGNLLMFVSPDAYNAYGHAITSGKIVYVAEVVLILALLAHIKTAISLTHQNFKARPQRYAMPTNGTKHTALASRTMAATGALVLAFVILHLASFKFGPHYETEVDGVKMRDLHRLLVEVFTQPTAKILASKTATSKIVLMFIFISKSIINHLLCKVNMFILFFL